MRFALSSETDRVRWVAGFYYLDIDIADANGAEVPGLGADPSGAGGNPTGIQNFIDFGFNELSAALAAGLFGVDGGAYIGVDNPYRQQKDSWSLFGQVEYETDRAVYPARRVSLD